MKLGTWSIDRETLRRDGLVLFSKLIRTKNVENLQEQRPREQSGADERKQKLTKCLTTLDLTSLGVGSCVGTGMYLVAGMVAKKVAGPGVVVSFIIAAVASIFSGACYAEFGVRVPHTTGSAYMYSYVTVGEFIAFVIGWNMILEYLIGTSACACALSACFDALANGAISKAILDSVGANLDALAFVITLLMMLLLAAGVKKSLIFNNVLNVINLAVWVFVMSAGLFFVNTDNWTKHKGFLPYGWSGVFTGAATCFYAFIGFDIIATTGEEAATPKKSIPLAIVTSLAIILIAYVTSSMMITLIVPYEDVDEDSALVEMFGQVGAFRCKYIVAIGALAGLTVSMFGSMFPMPRIIYAMAQDGLIFRVFAQVWPSTGTPALATFVSGLTAATAALFIRLEILVEMMSIGTLLAYTLVSTCVLILRYQPHSTNLVELLPQSLRTPLRGSPTADATDADAYYGDRLRPGQLRQAMIDATVGAQPPPPPQPSPSPLPGQTTTTTTQRVMVRRITRSSPDSDDTFGGDEPEEDFSGRDDQFLVSDRTENKFYGTLHGGGSATSTGGVVGSAVGPSLGYIGRRLQAATYLCPAIFPWVDTGPATEESGMFVMKMVGALYVQIIIFDLIVVCGMDDMGTATASFLCLFLAAIVAICLAISRKPQNRSALMFMTPGLPFVPVVAITVNIYLIMKLSYLTLIRFTIWMTLGLIMYFYYGIKSSGLETGEQGIELTVTEHEKRAASKKPDSPDEPTYDWDPSRSWDHTPSWARSAAAPAATKFQVEQRYDVETDGTRSVINGPPGGAAPALFVSDPLAYAQWDD